MNPVNIRGNKIVICTYFTYGSSKIVKVKVHDHYHRYDKNLEGMTYYNEGRKSLGAK